MRYKNSLGSAFLDSLNHALYVLLRQRTTVLHADLGELHGVIQAQHLKVAWDDRRNSRRCCILDTVIKRIDGATRQDDMNDLL